MSGVVNDVGSAVGRVPRPLGGVRWVSGLLLVLTLSACSDANEELQVWMDQQRQDVKPQVSPLVPPSKFQPQPYVAESMIDPFSGQKLAVAIKQETREPSSLLAAELNRRREPLEAYPLDALHMVGSVVKAGRPHALVRADNMLYQVKVGEYLGQNYGRVIRITETEVTVREVVQDAVGDWVERPATLSLQEQAQEKGR